VNPKRIFSLRSAAIVNTGDDIFPKLFFCGFESVGESTMKCGEKKESERKRRVRGKSDCGSVHNGSGKRACAISYSSLLSESVSFSERRFSLSCPKIPSKSSPRLSLRATFNHRLISKQT